MPVWVRAIIFYPMFWLRGISGLLLGFLTGLFLIGGILMMVAGAPWWIAVLYFGLSFVMFMVRQAYDAILLKLNPTGRMLILHQ